MATLKNEKFPEVSVLFSFRVGLDLFNWEDAVSSQENSHLFYDSLLFRSKALWDIGC